MGAVAEKLSYLNATKQLFKGRLNSLGANIIESTTFRNYLTWLDTFYNQSSDKTDLSINGIVGRTSQESTTGKNLFNLTSISVSTGTATLDNGEITLSWNAGFNLDLQNVVSNLINGEQYTISFKHKGDALYLRNKQVDRNTNILATNTDSDYTTYSITLNNITAFEFRFVRKDTTGTAYIKDIQIEKGSSATDWEKYTGGEPSPSPDYPLEINNLSGDVEYKVRGKNKLPFPYTETSHTHNGITYTINDDGTVLVNGTATAQSNTKLYENYQEANNKESIGKYLYGGTNEVRIRALNHTGNNYTVLATDTGNGAEIDTTVYKKYYIEISVLQGVTVNNVLIKPMVLDSLDDLKYEPYISESFPLSLKSRNLFDKNNTNILNAYIGGNTGTIANSNGDKCLYISIKPNTTYTISKVLSNRFRIGCTDALPNRGIICTPFSGNKDTSTSYTITSNNSSKYLIIYYYVETDILTEQQILDSIQIEESPTPTDYEPYYDINLCNISDYKDQIYSQNGEFYLEKKNGKVVLDGSENITQNYNQSMFRAPLDNFMHRIESPSNLGKSNYYTCRKYSDMYDGTIGTGFEFGNQGNDYIYIRNKDITSINDFKTWLSTHNTEVEYVLATPTTTEITQENYPTLYSQLLAIQEFLTKYKINKEFLLDYSSPEIEY